MLRLKCLGQCEANVNGTRIGPDAEVLFATLLYLVLERGRPAGRPTLLALLWPGEGGLAARHCLRQTLYKLKQLGVAFETTREHVVLATQGVSTDIDPFLNGAIDPAALEEIRGEFLPGYAPEFSEPLAEWVERQRAAAHAHLRRALLREMGVMRSRSRWVDVERLAHRALELDPLNEEATFSLAESVALSGSKAAAVAILDRYLAELGPGAREIKLPAQLLRRRIAERLPHRTSGIVDAPLIGRDEPMASLRALLDVSRAGRGEAAVIWGDQGIGKTRLAEELGRSAVLDGARHERVKCQMSDIHRPLSVFVDLVPALLKLPGALGVSPASLGYLRRLTEHDTGSTALSEDSRDAELLYANVVRSIFDLLDAVSAEGTLVLVVEDVQWLDSISWKVMRQVLPWLRTRTAMLVMTSHALDAAADGLAEASAHLHSLRLGPLADADARRMLAAMTSKAATPMDDAFAQWCVRVAGGNPLYLRELASHWHQTGAAYAMPASLAALIEERLLRLSRRALRALQACAALGKNSTLDRLEKVLGYRPHEMIDAVEELESAGFVAEEGTAVVTRHDLVATGAFEKLRPTARRMLHRRIALVLEVEPLGSNSSGLLWDCATHWWSAGEIPHAIDVMKRCAEHLIELGLPDDAAQRLESVLQYATSPSDRADLRQLLSVAFSLAGRWKRLLALAEISPTDPSDTRSPTHDSVELSVVEAKWRTADDTPSLLKAVRHCLDDESAPEEHRIEAAFFAMIFADNLCLPGEGHSVYEQIKHSLTRSELPAAAALETVYHASFGSIARGMECARTLIERTRARGNLRTLLLALRRATIALRRGGRFAEAFALAQESYSTAVRLSLMAQARHAADYAATIWMEAGKLNAARHWYARALDCAAEDDDYRVTESMYHLGIKLSFFEGWLDDSAVTQLTSLDKCSRDSDLRRKLELISVHAWIRMLRGQQDELATCLEVLTGIFPPIPADLGQDFTAYTIASALRWVGRPERASTFLEKYSASRRAQSPVPWFMSDSPYVISYLSVKYQPRTALR